MSYGSAQACEVGKSETDEKLSHKVGPSERESVLWDSRLEREG